MKPIGKWKFILAPYSFEESSLYHYCDYYDLRECSENINLKGCVQIKIKQFNDFHWINVKKDDLIKIEDF